MAKQSESTPKRDPRDAPGPKQSVDTPKGPPPADEQPNPGDPGPPVLRPD